MKLNVDRLYKKELYTIGRLSIDGTLFCNTLEDTDRGLRSDMPLEEIRSVKVAGKTAIPTGVYKVTMNVKSPKFSQKPQYDFTNGFLPRLQNVPGYDGILIHAGETAEWTDGCILVGDNKKTGRLTNSMEVFTKLFERMKAAAERNESIYIAVN
jgi:hypothetical protein